MDDIYQDHILEHSRRPENRRVLPHADATATAENSLCGDTLTIFLRIEKGEIADAGFTGEGCALSVASADILCGRLRGMPESATTALAPGNIYDMLGISVTPARSGCALLGLRALRAALSDKKKNDA